MRPFKPHEVPLLMKAFEGDKYELRNKSLLALGINTGFRISELLALKVDDVYHYGKVNDRIIVPKRFMKGDRPRRPKKVFPESKKYLEQWYKLLRDEFNATLRSFVFVSRKSKQLQPESAWAIINRAAEKAGLNTQGLGTHSMRKTFANAVYDYWVQKAREGERIEPMRMVQRELGHANIEDTYSYMEFKLEEKPDDIFKEYDLMLSKT